MRSPSIIVACLRLVSAAGFDQAATATRCHLPGVCRGHGARARSTTLLALAIACTACRNPVGGAHGSAIQATPPDVTAPSGAADRRVLAEPSADQPIPAASPGSAPVNAPETAGGHRPDPVVQVNPARGEPPADASNDASKQSVILKQPVILPPSTQPPRSTRTSEIAATSAKRLGDPGDQVGSQSAPVATEGRAAEGVTRPPRADAPISAAEGPRTSDLDPVVQAALARVALRDPDWSVRIAAVERLTLQPVLARIALSDRDSDIRTLAVSLLRDQSALARVAQVDRNWSVRISAVNQLVDKGVLTQVALNDHDPDIRKRAVARLLELAGQP